MEDIVTAQLKGSLQDLIYKTEKIYLNMAERFPELFKELDLGFEEAKQIVSYFIDPADKDTSLEGYGLVENVIEEAKIIINNAAQFFQDMQKRDENLFGSINESIENLNTMDTTIENIREDSIEMELISINAMTAAIRAGVAGKAFSYITEELKKLSTQTIGFTNELIGRGKEELEIFFTFRNTIESVRDFQNRFYSDFKDKLNESFNTYNLGIKKLAEILFEIIDEAGNVKKPLVKIMEEVQLQDIIRQSVEHVIISLKEIESLKESSKENEAAKARLNELSLLEKIPELCINVLSDVEEKIETSLSTFRHNFEELSRILQSVEEQRSIFLEYFTADESGEDGAVDQMFSESAGVLEELLRGIDGSVKDKKKINQEGYQVINGLKVLEESFEAFFDIINRFYSIEVASRIEVAKQSKLKDHQGTVEEMTELTEKIEKDIKGALKTITKALARTETNIEVFSSEMDSEYEMVSDMRKKIQQSYESLAFSKETLTDTLGNFSVFTGHFFKLMDLSEKDMKKLDELLRLLEEIKNSLKNVKETSQAKKIEALKEAGLEEWQIEDSKMQEIIGRFTIFTHKKAAGDLAGFEVEEGSDPGELTLF